MSLMRVDPYSDFQDLSKLMNRFFVRSPEAANEKMTTADWAPVVDVAETAEAYVIHAELPGAKKDDIHINVEDGFLTLKGERKSEHEEKGKKFHRVERSYGTFMRSFRIPENVDETNVYAAFTDGVLEVKLPKAKPTPKPNTQVKIN